MRRFVVIVGAVIAGLSTAAAVANVSPAYDPERNLVKARSFDEFALYYAGLSIEDHPLTAVHGYEASEEYGRADRRGSRWFWDFGYGDCTPPKGEGGCPLPVSMTVTSTCRRWASAYTRPTRLFALREARATWTAAEHLDIYTGRTTISIYTFDRELALRVADALRRVRDDQPVTRLPPPAKGSLQGRLPCQVKPG